MNLQKDYAMRDRERYEKTFLPMQDQYIKEANEYDTAARREDQAGNAMADTQRQAEAARANSDQRLRSMGLDPSQMRSASLLETQDVMGAAQQAAAANQARQQVENQGRAMRADAMNLGMGLPAQAAQGFGGSGAAGQGALGAGQAGQGATLNAIQGGAGVGSQAMGFRSNALNNLSNLTGSPMQWAGMGNQSYNTALGGYGAAGNTINQGFANRNTNWQNGQQQSQQMMSNVMGAAGMVGGMWAEGGEVRGYAEGGDVNDYYAEGGMQETLGTPMSRRPMPQQAGVGGPQQMMQQMNQQTGQPLMQPQGFGGGRPMGAGQNMAVQAPLSRAPMQRPGVQPGRQLMAEGGFMKKLGDKFKAGQAENKSMSMKERFRKGLTMASMAPENSWAGGDTGTGQYMDAIGALANKDYMDDPAAARAAAAPQPPPLAITQRQQEYGPHMAEGGQARGPMRARGAIPSRQARDNIPAYLAEGEYVLPADVVRALGIEKLDKMVAKYHRENA